MSNVKWVDTIHLSEKVTLGDSEVSEIKIRQIKAKDFRHFKVGKDLTFGDLLDLGASASNLPHPKFVNELGFQDMNKLVEVVSQYIQDGGPTE